MLSVQSIMRGKMLLATLSLALVPFGAAPMHAGAAGVTTYDQGTWVEAMETSCRGTVTSYKCSYSGLWNNQETQICDEVNPNVPAIAFLGCQATLTGSATGSGNSAGCVLTANPVTGFNGIVTFSSVATNQSYQVPVRITVHGNTAHAEGSVNGPYGTATVDTNWSPACMNNTESRWPGTFTLTF